MLESARAMIVREVSLARRSQESQAEAEITEIFKDA
jgi:RNA polymerase-interacting CarD/CdnL/TRCF family regulator